MNKKKFYYFLYRTLNYLPHNINLFEIAFIHKSASVNSNGSVINNERLEYLGDAILDAVIAEYLFAKYPDKSEGFLTKLKSRIVNREQLNDLALKLGLDQFLVTQTSTLSNVKYITGNAFEAMLGAIFIDAGYYKTRQFILERVLKKHINLQNLELSDSDYKSLMIEWSQKNKHDIIFDTAEDEGHSDSTPKFISKVMLAEDLLGTGYGRSKKEAEQNASKKALEFIKEKGFYN
jgi:ribonuclease III